MNNLKVEKVEHLYDRDKLRQLENKKHQVTKKLLELERELSEIMYDIEEERAQRVAYFNNFYKKDEK